MLMPMYTAQWETKLVTDGGWFAEAVKESRARTRWLPSETTQSEEQLQPRKVTLRRLVAGLGYGGA